MKAAGASALALVAALLVLLHGFGDTSAAAFWLLFLVLLFLTAAFAVAALALVARGEQRSAREVARIVAFVVFALVLAPAAGFYLSLWVIGQGRDSDAAAWLGLLGIPAALTIVAGLLTRRSGWTTAVVASLSAGVSFLALFALIYYAASQGAFD